VQAGGGPGPAKRAEKLVTHDAGNMMHDKNEPSSLPALGCTRVASMRALLQRVRRARVLVEQETVGAIERGLLVLLGVTHADTAEQARWLAEKVATLRIFADENGKMNLDVSEAGGAVLVVSQFTLYGDCRKGRRPSFVDAAPPDVAIPLYEAFIDALKAQGVPTATGRFGAMMQVELVNDGPVTLLVDSK
jgi:D-tyrosyl-tRNA(Tyr) deacylase